MDGWNFRVVWKKKREAIYIYPPLFRFNHLEICIVKDYHVHRTTTSFFKQISFSLSDFLPDIRRIFSIILHEIYRTMLNIRANIGASFYYYYQKLIVRIVVSLISISLWIVFNV